MNTSPGPTSMSVMQQGFSTVYLRWLVMPAVFLIAGLQTATAGDPLLERCRYLFTAAGCASCHTRDQSLAGGLPLVTPFGTCYPPNTSPDREQGIAGWSVADFRQALGEGVNPQGEHYYPAFPYTSYTRMTPAYLRALYAYLMKQRSVTRASRAHDLPWCLST